MKRVRINYLLLNDADVSMHDEQKEPTLINQWLMALPPEKQASLKRLLSPRDRLVSLIAQQLLKICVADEGVDDFRLSDICYPATAKPYWSATDSLLDFNISHSAELIVVAVSQTLKLGIDVEQHRQLKSLNFKMVMSNAELDRIKKDSGMFFDLWSIKEAVVKAANTTGIARMRDVKISQQQAILDGKTWQLTDVDLVDESYAAFLATSDTVDELIVKRLSMKELIEQTG